MKQIILGVLLILGTFNIQAQERKNDVVVDPILLIAVPMLNISYERLLSKDMGVGVNAMITLNDDVDNFKQFSPYVRYYTGKKYASGFFFEVFTPVTVQNDVYYYTNYESPTQNYYHNTKSVTTVGIGFGVGGKWAIKDRLIIEASGGIARRFGNLDQYDVGAVTGKVMAGIGYRF